MSKGAWCTGCQRGNMYNDKGECQDCKTVIARPYVYMDHKAELETVMDAIHEEPPKKEIKKVVKKRKKRKKKVLSES